MWVEPETGIDWQPCRGMVHTSVDHGFLGAWIVNRWGDHYCFYHCEGSDVGRTEIAEALKLAVDGHDNCLLEDHRINYCTTAKEWAGVARTIVSIERWVWSKERMWQDSK